MGKEKVRMIRRLRGDIAGIKRVEGGGLVEGRIVRRGIEDC